MDPTLLKGFILALGKLVIRSAGVKIMACRSLDSDRGAS
jgi:hypothetical protein